MLDARTFGPAVSPLSSGIRTKAIFLCFDTAGRTSFSLMSRGQLVTMDRRLALFTQRPSYRTYAMTGLRLAAR